MFLEISTGYLCIYLTNFFSQEFIVVNGIIASPFGANHMLANMYYNVHRLLYQLSPKLLESKLLHKINEDLGFFSPIFGPRSFFL